MYQVILYNRIKKFLEPIWRFRPSTRLLIVGSSVLLVGMIILGSTFLDEILRGINVRNQLYQETERGDTKAPEFSESLNWIDGKNHKLGENNAKVTVLHFWSAACVTCIDAYGRIAQWHDLYSQYGLQVYGIYAPQFDFEIDQPELIQKTLDDNSMSRFAVAFDETYEFNNAFYKATESFSSDGSVIVMIDKDGYIRHVIPDATNLVNGELVIQGLLRDAGVEDSFILPTGRQRAGSSISTNLFFNEDDAETEKAFIAKEKLSDAKQTYTTIEELAIGQWSLGGTWTRNEDHLQAISNGTITTRFTGKRAYIVVAPDSPDFIGILIGSEKGKHRAQDVAKDGILKISEPGVYQVMAADKTLRNTDLLITVADNMKLYQLVVLPD